MYARLPNDFIPVSLREQDTLGMSQAILLCFEKAVYHRPDESPRQFGLEKEESVSASSTHMPNSSALASGNSAQTPSEDTLASQFSACTLWRLLAWENVCLEMSVGCKLMLKDVGMRLIFGFDLISIGKLDEGGKINDFG
ncbi:hypothetical protein RHSIM_Rhsim10G0102300 [Rhododendron simsii]|uniref:Uncharacterized protein n=1 Tax=Rhododendron simsii TaxID=118357 RepID=A0A834G9H7_RHOSS|nr:hypothetical protein RHSIM_Rhsim10G0102300 [Rhododendron simsii]